jgi:oligopeptide/dipeptide ABC transporter ATP-binding protein
VPGKGRRARQVLPPEEIGPVSPTGCPFYPRCKEKTPRCLEAVPQLKDRGDGHAVACVHHA